MKHISKFNLYKNNLKGFAQLQANTQLSENKEIINRLVQKDFDYFVKQMESQGVADIVSKLNSLNLDIQSKYGRELLLAKEQVLKRLVYYERSEEEHQNISINICEADLFKIYEEHV